MYEHTAIRCLFEALFKVSITRKNYTADERSCEVVVPINFDSFKCVRKQILEKRATLINAVFTDNELRTRRPWKHFLYILFDGAKDSVFQTRICSRYFEENCREKYLIACIVNVTSQVLSQLLSVQSESSVRRRIPKPRCGSR
jgi:hypothetical protein